MSQDLAITCEQCKRYLAIGKSSARGWYVFIDTDVQAALSKFVDRHFEHPIKFMDLDGVPFGFDDEEDGSA